MHSANIPARRTPAQHRSRQTVEAVLAAVPVVLKRHGAASITTNRIAEVAGVSIGSLYQYFPDKRSIFSALQERHVADVRSVFERHTAACRSSSFNAFVVGLVEDLVDLHSIEAELHHVISDALNEGPEHFRAALRMVFAEAIAADAKNMDRILFVLPNLIEGVVHGMTQSPLTCRDAKSEAMRATLAYLTAHPELA